MARGRLDAKAALHKTRRPKRRTHLYKVSIAKIQLEKSATFFPKCGIVFIIFNSFFSHVTKSIDSEGAATYCMILKGPAEKNARTTTSHPHHTRPD